MHTVNPAFTISGHRLYRSANNIDALVRYLRGDVHSPYQLADDALAMGIGDRITVNHVFQPGAITIERMN
jgi:hypothetical protein